MRRLYAGNHESLKVVLGARGRGDTSRGQRINLQNHQTKKCDFVGLSTELFSQLVIETFCPLCKVVSSNQGFLATENTKNISWTQEIVRAFCQQLHTSSDMDRSSSTIQARKSTLPTRLRSYPKYQVWIVLFVLAALTYKVSVDRGRCPDV